MRQLRRNWREFFANTVSLGFGAGLSPFAPGTMGTLVAIPLYWVMHFYSKPVYGAVTAVLFVLGIVCAQITERSTRIPDNPAIVWDEIVGYLCTMMWVPFTVITVVLGFALFRFFDIVKPWPIGWCDKRIKGGLGIMLDDVLASIYAGSILLVYTKIT